MSSQNANLIVIREKIAILESKRDQIVKTLEAHIERAITVAEIPVYSKRGEDEMCIPFINLLDRHIKACTQVFQQANAIFGNLVKDIDFAEFSHLEETNWSVTTSNSSVSSQPVASAHLLKDIPEDAGEAGLNLGECIRDTVMRQLYSHSQEMRETLVRDISSVVIQHLTSVLESKGDKNETSVKTVFSHLDDADNVPGPGRSRGEEKKPEETLEKRTMNRTGVAGGGMATEENPESRLSPPVRPVSSSSSILRNPSSSSSLPLSPEEEISSGDGFASCPAEVPEVLACKDRKHILAVPTSVIGEAYPPNVFFHGHLAHSVDIIGATILKFEDYYVLQDVWYESENGIFTGLYRCFIDVKAWYKQKEEKKRSTCFFRLSRNEGRPCYWASCEMTSLWWENDAKTATADEEILLNEGEEIYFEAGSMIGQWETMASEVTLMIIFCGT